MLKKIVLLLLIFTSCAQQSSVDTETLTIGSPTEPSNLLPYTTNDGHSYRVRWQIYDRLVTLDNEGNVIPGLAESWKNVNPTTLELKIRQGVNFHNGDPLTVEDIKYSIESAARSSSLSTTVGIIKEAIIVDNSTIQIVFRSPNAAALSLLSTSGLLISSKKIMEQAESNPEASYIGTGPYKFISWAKGEEIVLERNDDYWGEPAHIKTVVYRVIPEASVRLIGVETGEIDIALEVDGADRNSAMNNPNINYLEELGSRMDYLGFNTSKAPFNNKKVREAVALAIDITGMINTVMFGSADLASGAINKTVFGYYDGLKARERDIEKAKQLLTESGIDTSKTYEILAIEGFRRRLAEVLQANLKEIGLDIKITVLEWSTFLDGITRGRSELFFLGWTTSPLDADNGLYPILHSDSLGAGGNYSFYNNPQLDEFLNQGRLVNDPEQRKEFYKKALELVHEELPLLPMFYLYNNVATTKSVYNFTFNPFGYYEYKYVMKK